MNGSEPMRGDDLKRASGARFCESHDRWECVAKPKNSSGACHGIAIDGLDKCRMHVGKRGAVAKSEGEALNEWRAVTGQVAVAPAEAVLGMLQLSWLRARMYGSLLQAQVDVEGENAGAAVAGAAAGDDDARSEGGTSGLIGHTYASGKDVGVFASGEAVRALVALEAAERDRVVRVAKTAHDMGIAEREIRLAEAQGVMLAAVVRRILDRLELTEAQRRLIPVVVPEELRAVEAAASGAGA